jgi:hypothetical protein
MINGDRPTLGPNAGRKRERSVRRALGAASDALGLARCTGRTHTRPSMTGIWEMSDRDHPGDLSRGESGDAEPQRYCSRYG